MNGEHAWLARWEKMDFSWAGLADAGWDSGDAASESQTLKRWRAPADFPGDGKVRGSGPIKWRESNLQEYWRWTFGPGEQRLIRDDELIKAGLLVDVDGKQWHVLYVPGVDATEHDELRQTLLVRLNPPKQTKVLEDAPDFRAQLTGARVRGLAEIWRAFGGPDSQGGTKELYINAAYTQFETLDARELVFGHRASFDRSILPDLASFNGASFNNYSSFDWAIFGDQISFESARFGVQASFEHTTFGRQASFRLARFHNDASFRSATFGDHAVFQRANFGSKTSFAVARFGNRTSFDRASFGEQTSFDMTHFDGVARFVNTSFGSHAAFDSATFYDGASFDLAAFGIETSFCRTEFGGHVTFHGATFDKMANFSEGVFGEVASFSGTVFGDQVRFDGVTLEGRFDFQYTTFEGLASFQGAKLATAAADCQWAFGAARFRELANFDGIDIQCFAAFDTARFDSRIILKDSAGRSDELFRRAVVSTKAASLEDAHEIRSEAEVPIREDENDEDYFARRTGVKARIRDACDARFAALEGGCRTLKQEMEKLADRVREQRYYRYELIARRHRPTIHWTERFASHAYGLVADYGTSIHRPTLWFLASIFVVAALFYPWAVGGFANVHVELGTVPDPDLWDAVHFAAQNVIRPFAIWDGRYLDSAPGLVKRFVQEQGAGWWLLVKVLCTLHSFFGIMLLFLFGVAVKRKFQIK